MIPAIFTNEAWPIFRLAGPVLLSRTGAFLIIAVDTAMCGYAGTEQIAFYGLAHGPHVSLILIGIGSILPIAILTASADGAGSYANCGMILRVGMTHAFVLGIILGIAMLFGEQFLLLTGQDPELAHGAGRVMAMQGYGLAGLLCMVALSLFLEGLQRPMAATVVTLGSNVLNAYLNWIFIFGNHGAPAMGAEGAALATTIIRWVSVAALGAYIFFTFDRVKYGIIGKIEHFREFSLRLRMLGYPTAIGHGMESASFVVMTLFAGYMGVVQTAAWAIGMNMITLAFMVALGFGTAASVRVANHFGSGSRQLAARSGWTAIALAALSLGLISVVFVSFPQVFATLYSQESRVLMIAIPTVVAAGLTVFLDGLQAVGVGILRGYQDMWFITMTMIITFWVVMLPLAWLFGFHMDGGPPGLMWSVGIACVVAVVMLFMRFRYLIKTR